MNTDRVISYRHAGMRFTVTDSGPLTGPVVVLLHGFPANRTALNAVAERLNSAGIRTLAPDQRGYSPGAAPRNRLRYRSAEITGDAIALIEAIGIDRVHVVGHDWGGFVAWKLAISFPHRLNGVTVLSTPHPSALLRSLYSSAQLVRSAYIGFFQLPVVPEALLRQRLARLLWRTGLPAVSAKHYQRFMERPGSLRGALNWYRGIWIKTPRQFRTDLAAGDRVRIPTTYIWGRRDAALGHRAARLTADYVDGPYRFIELDQNHWLPECEPDRVAQEILADVNRRG
jgi:pimeloyl-ACP methyl ester carboxylesterase